MTLFDDRGADAVEADASAEPVTWSVAELGNAILVGLRASFPTEVWVSGEIRSLRPPNRNGHQYFDLIEPGVEPGAYPRAKMSVNLFRTARAQIAEVLRAATGSAELTEGIEVRIRARVDWWVAGGQLRLIMSDIDPVFTLGQLDAQRRALLAQLKSEGLLDRNSELAVPPVPLRVGLVTSAGSAAYEDFVDELRGSRYAFDVVLADARVQGAEAVPTLVAAIARLTAEPLDVIAVVRGGGSRTDLVAFDHSDVAHAIARSPVPVFTGVGHEIDRSVADEVAHTAFKTPTATASGLVTLVGAAETAWVESTARLARLGDLHLASARSRLQGRLRRVGHAARVADTRAAGHVAALRRQLMHAAAIRLRSAERDRHFRVDRLTSMAPRRLEQQTRRLVAADDVLRAYDPARILARGWSLTRDANGNLVRSGDQVAPGDALVTRLADATLTSTVTATTTEEDSP